MLIFFIMALTLARFNMVDPEGDAQAVGERYRAFLDMASYMDENDFYGVSLEEHHGVDDGWSPTPLLNAAMVLARTKNLSVTVSALLLPLHNPISVAENIAVADLVGQGRMITILALGYRPSEYHMMQKDWKNRGKLMDECLETVVKALSGEPFEYKGEEIIVRPRPITKPMPTIMVGGTTRPAARRAARFGLPMMTAANIPELEAYYYEQCKENGTQGFFMMPSVNTQMLFVDEDPDKAWDELGKHFLHEASRYGSWQTPDIKSQVSSKAGTVKELRAEGIYAIMTPEQCLEKAKAEGDSVVFSLHPLCGGISIERGWDCLKLFTEKVLKKL